MKTARVGLTILLCVASVAFGSQGDDWKLLGATAGKDNDALFYLASEIRKTTAGTLRVWVKSVNFGKLVKAADGLSPGSPSAKAVIEKGATGYQPPYSSVQTLSPDGLLNVIIWEQLADDDADIPTRTHILWEVNCDQWEFRTVTIQVGNKPPSQVPTSWQPIPPESNPRALAKLVCAKGG
jgi:hypothetical protein